MFLVATINEGGESTVHDALEDFSGLTRGVGFRYPERELTLLVGIGSDAWDRLFAGPRPSQLHPFKEVKGDRFVAPSTPGDLLFHIRADTMDMCFELATRISDTMDGAITVVDEVHGFRYFDQRDLLGFVDGTENPTGELAESSTTIGGEDPRFAGGHYVHIQKYLHDMTAWKALTVEEQENVIGRKKLDDIEIPDDKKKPNAHIVLNTIDDEQGRELKIVRLNMPFGDVGKGEFGTFYIGYSRNPDVTERMLDNMFIGDPPGNTDAILDFSTAVTGCMFYVATDAFLDDPLPFTGADSVTSEPEPSTDSAPSAQGGSLSIGSLKGQN